MNEPQQEHSDVLAPMQALSYLEGQRSKHPLRREITVGVLLLLGMVVLLFAPFPIAAVRFLGETSPWRFAVEGLYLVIRAFFFGEFLFYFLHRYFEHTGVTSRTLAFVRQNQQYHWIHHMVIYPLNKQYKKSNHYVNMTRGISSSGWHAFLSGLIIIGSVVSMGFSWQAILFDLCMLAYGKGISHVHDRFHYHSSWDGNRYFQWLEDIHMLHHFDQNKNYTIVLPLVDWLFGTYYSPKGAMAPIRKYLASNDLNPSDFISYAYLVQEARPTERAVFVSAIQKYHGERRKVLSMIQALDQIGVDEPYAREADTMKESLKQFVAVADAAEAASTVHTGVWEVPTARAAA